MFGWFKKKKESSEPGNYKPLRVSELPEVEILSTIKDNKKQLRHLDEMVSIAEEQIITISKDLDKNLLDERKVKEEITLIENQDTWQEQGLLLKLKRLKTHSNNLKQRVIIYSQNIELYLNLISRIQDQQAMKMGGLDETKIETTWLEYKEELADYRNKLITAQSAAETDTALSTDTQEKLQKLKTEVLAETKREPIENFLVKESTIPDKIISNES